MFFSSPYTIFVPIAQQAGQAAVLGLPSLTVVSISGLDSLCFPQKRQAIYNFFLAIFVQHSAFISPMLQINNN